METKIGKISELSKLLSVKNRMSDNLFHLFGKFGIGHLLSRLSLEKQDGITASELILSLCLFRIVGECIHHICKQTIQNIFYCHFRHPIQAYNLLIHSIFISSVKSDSKIKTKLQ